MADYVWSVEGIVALLSGFWKPTYAYIFTLNE